MCLALQVPAVPPNVFWQCVATLPCDVNTLEKPSSIVNPKEEQFLTIVCWLVVSTPLNNISQWEGLSHILKIKKKFETTNQFG
jgi:hypothetical protein